jgi:endonuclease/exonuclease/phosphatase family metal-dependent hydrolase
MKKIFRFLVRLIGRIIVVVLLILVGLILYNMINSFSPAEIENVEVIHKIHGSNPASDTLTFANWNIGYGGLGREIDFFYEGGSQVRPSYEDYLKYMHGIRQIMQVFTEMDFLLLQEVDSYAKRSYFQNQVEQFWGEYRKGSMALAINYDVKFVPVPFNEPMGRVLSGIVTYSQFNAGSAVRYGFPFDESWPTRLFMLNRCYLLTRYELGDKTLTVINTHNSAYDESGEAKMIQLQMLREKMLEEYKLGHYVIAGGDWNQNPPGFNAKEVSTDDVVKTIIPLVPADLLPANWTWAWDPEIPTNRNVDIAYQKGSTQTTIIDYYAVSPNVEVLEVETHATNFEFTDHQPVKLTVRLK